MYLALAAGRFCLIPLELVAHGHLTAPQRFRSDSSVVVA